MKIYGDKKDFIKAKIAAYAAWLSVNPDELTDDEVEIGYLLSKDADIQKSLDEFRNEYTHYPSGHVDILQQG